MECWHELFLCIYIFLILFRKAQHVYYISYIYNSDVLEIDWVAQLVHVPLTSPCASDSIVNWLTPNVTVYRIFHVRNIIHKTFCIQWHTTMNSAHEISHLIFYCFSFKFFHEPITFKGSCLLCHPMKEILFELFNIIWLNVITARIFKVYF